MINNLRFLALAFVVSLSATRVVDAATALPPQGFDAGTADGWVNNASPAGQPMVQPSGGRNGDGDPFLQVTSRGGNGPTSIPAVFNNGADWTGDFAGITGLTVDLMNAPSSSPLDLRLVLFGPNSTNNRWTSSEAVRVVNDGQWNSYFFPIGEPDFTRVRGSSSFDEAASSVVRFMIRHDAGTPSAGGTGLSAQFGIDNIGFVAEPTQLCGDFDMDGDVDVADRTIQTQNWTGALESGDPNADRAFKQGDCDADGDVDVADQTATIQNWTGAMAAGNLTDGGDADLVYHPELGNVTLDPGPFTYVGANTDNTPYQVGQTDPLNLGAGPHIDLGDLLPPGTKLASLSDYLSLAEYASELGEGGTLDLIVVPEPSAPMLFLIGFFGLFTRIRR